MHVSPVLFFTLLMAQIIFDIENEIKLYIFLTNVKRKNFLDSSLPLASIKMKGTLII